MSGSSYYSQNDFRLHFGLGGAIKADRVELTWPSGLKESFQNLPATSSSSYKKGREYSTPGNSDRTSMGPS